MARRRRLTTAKTSMGIYTATVPTIDQTGRHIVKFFGTGALGRRRGDVVHGPANFVT